MKHYIGKRILLFFPTLLIISLLAFIISVNAPGDPLDRMLMASNDGGEQSSTSNLSIQKKIWREKLGLNLPIFYFELSDWASPDTLYKIENSQEREALERLLFECGNWKYVSVYNASIRKLKALISYEKVDSSLVRTNTKTDLLNAITEAQTALTNLQNSYSKRTIQFQFQILEANLSYLKFTTNYSSLFNEIRYNYQAIQNNKSTWKNYIPYLHFHANNQYHYWLFGDGNWLTGSNSSYSKGVIRGDFGTSFASKEPVSLKIWARLKVSLFFSLLSIVFAYLISIPIAVKAASNPHSRFDKISSLALFSLYSLPSFFFATLLLMTFANPDMFYWFPASGISPAAGIPENTGLWESIKIQFSYLLLPLICYTYSSLAFLSRSMRSSLLENLSLDYIRTARAKGLSERSVVYMHALKNALLPLLTLFATVLPYAIGGSVVLETIFTLPGMGLEIYTAIQNQDYPVIVAVFTMTGLVTLIGTLVIDILYAFFDPRISFTKTA